MPSLREALVARREALVSSNVQTLVLPPRPSPHQVFADRRKEYLAGAREDIEAMSDDELALEAISLAERIDLTRADIHAAERGEGDAVPGWRIRAEHAIGHARSRRKLVAIEVERRRRQRETEARSRRDADLAGKAAREVQMIHEKTERERIKSEREARWERRFVTHAKAVLDADILHMIMDAVEADMKADA